MTTTDPTTGLQIVSGDYDEAAAHHDAMLREIESREIAAAEIIDDLRTVLALSPGQSLTQAVTQLRDDLAWLRSQLAEAREALARAETERDEALCAITKIAEALGFPGGDLREAIRALRRERDDALQERDRWQQLADERAQNLHATLRRAFAAEDVALAARREAEALKTERDEARAEIARLERAAHEQGADLWTAEDWVDWLRKRVRLAMDLLSHVLATTAPETAPESPQTDDQAGVRADTHTGAETGSQGPLDLDAIRAAWLRVCGSCDAGYPTACTCPTADPRAIIAALVTELDQLRAEIDRLRTPRIEDGATVHIDDGRYAVVDVDFRGETAVVTLRPATTGDSDA